MQEIIEFLRLVGPGAFLALMYGVLGYLNSDSNWSWKRFSNAMTYMAISGGVAAYSGISLAGVAALAVTIGTKKFGWKFFNLLSDPSKIRKLTKTKAKAKK